LLAKFFEFRWGIDGKGGFLGEGSGVDGVEAGFFGIGESGEVTEDEAKPSGGNL